VEQSEIMSAATIVFIRTVLSESSALDATAIKIDNGRVAPELIRHFLNNSSENWKTRSTTTAARPVATTVNTSTLNFRTTALFLAARHTIGRLTAALDKEASTVVLPARAALIFPCLAIVAAAAVVHPLLERFFVARQELTPGSVSNIHVFVDEHGGDYPPDNT